MTRQECLDQLGDDETVVFLEGPEFDVAILGLVARFGQEPFVCYDYERVLQVLRDGGMTEDGVAEEWYDYNIIGAWMGEGTPCFLHQFPSNGVTPTR